MKKLRRADITKKLALLLVMFLSLHLRAATYYVAKTGDDGNPGTEADPWLTIERAITVVDAGDTCWVKQGTYKGMVHPDTFRFGTACGGHDGTAGHPIVFASYDGWSTVLRSFVLQEGNHTEIRDFKILFDSATFAGGGTAGFKSWSNYSVLHGCEVVAEPETMYTGYCGIYWGSGCHDITIDSNVVHGWGGIDSTGHHGHGIYCAGPNKVHATITHNTIYNNCSYGIQCYPKTESCEVAYNVCWGQYRESGIAYEGGGGRIHDNISYNNNGCGIKVTGSGELWEIGNKVYNNVCYGNRSTGISWGNLHPADSLFNNLLLYNKSQIAIRDHANTFTDYNCVWPDSNVFYPESSSIAGSFQWIDDNMMVQGRLADYRAATGNDAHGMAAAPLCVDAAAYNFRLTASSPCIDKGDPLTTPGCDFDGVWRPQGSAPDMGAYEYHTYATTNRPITMGILGWPELGSVSFTIAPNPLSGGSATVRYSLPHCRTGSVEAKPGLATLNVFDVTGRTVLSQTLPAVRTGTVNLDLRNRNAGVYMVKVITDVFSATQKLVVER